MASSDLVSQREAAAILNRSVSAVSRAIKCGRLDYADPKNRLLLRPGLEARFRQKTRPRIDAPQRKTQETRKPLPARLNNPQPVSCDYWQRLTDKLSFVLDGSPAYWQRDPDSHQLMLFCKTVDELRSQVELEGLAPKCYSD